MMIEINERSRVRQVLGRYPGTREQFERYGLMGCGGPEGPDEPIVLFARAHGIDPNELVAELQAAARREQPAAGAVTPPKENYRYYLRAAVLVGILAGAALGTLNLTWIAAWGWTGEMPHWPWWPALIQAHGDAQLFGWTGLFIIGIAGHSLPRMLQRPGPPGWLARAVFALILGGLTLGLFAQPLAVNARLAPLFPLAMGFQWLGVTLYMGYVLRTIRWPRQPWSGFVFAGTLWFWLGATARLWQSTAAVSASAVTAAPEENGAYLHMMTWGFLLCYVLGYSLRLLPTFAGLPEGKRSTAWTALLFLTAGALANVGAQYLSLPLVSAAAMLLTLMGVGCGVTALRLGARALSMEDAEAVWLARFSRTAYFWLGAATVLLLALRIREVVGPVSPIQEHAFGGAARHALTVGFVSLMMIGVAWRILPIFSGAARPRAWLQPAVFGLLVAGNTIRVSGQIAAGLWGGAWYGFMGLSGWLELTAIILFGLDVLRLLSGTPEETSLPDPGAPVALSFDAPVGALVAHRPWLVPVFARHGMGQVSNPLFQRTVGQRVTLAQACRRFQVEAQSFLSELQAADTSEVGGG